MIREELEGVQWDPITDINAPDLVYVMPGVPVEVCEMIPAHWAQRRVLVEAHAEEQQYTIPGHWHTELKEIPGYWKDEQVYVEGHYGHKEVWFEAYTITVYKEIPGYFETRYRPTAMADARGMSEPTEAYQFWVDATFEPYQEIIPAGLRTTRVWIPGGWEIQKVWVPARTEKVKVWVEDKIVTYITSEPVRYERETYWQQEYELCRPRYDVPQVAGMAEMTPAVWKTYQEWFAWYCSTPGGQMYMDIVTQYRPALLENVNELIMKAYQGYRHFNPDVTIRAASDVVFKIRPWEWEKLIHDPKIAKELARKGFTKPISDILAKYRGEVGGPLTPEETALLIKAGIIAAAIVAGALLIYHVWPGAKYDFKVTYTGWTYVLRYKEEFQYANLVSISPKGIPYYHGCTQWGGPIMGEERSAYGDTWHFGEPWQWSAWVEQGKWMLITEWRYWYDAEVEYLGMVKRSGANFYFMPEKVKEDACAGHEPGWMLPAQLWEVIEEEWWHKRI
ncbi:MAG: hypothetical protein WAV28_18795 [Sedimentisphaerales bacterium]